MSIAVNRPLPRTVTVTSLFREFPLTCNASTARWIRCTWSVCSRTFASRPSTSTSISGFMSSLSSGRRRGCGTCPPVAGTSVSRWPPARAGRCRRSPRQGGRPPCRGDLLHLPARAGGHRDTAVPATGGHVPHPRRRPDERDDMNPEMDVDVEGLLAKVREQTDQVQRIQRAVEALQVKGNSRNNEVTVTVRGNGRFTAIDIDPEAVRR